MIINNKWFTLIELIIVIAIMWIMMTMAYTPYNYFQKKAELKIAAKEISKTLSESRNMAIHWVSSWSINQSIWVYFDSNNKNIIKIYSYDYNNRLNRTKLKDIRIQTNIEVNKIWLNSTWLFFYESITWEWQFYEKLDFTNHISDNIINIEFSYKWATSNLIKTLEYYTKTYISDY